MLAHHNQHGGYTNHEGHSPHSRGQNDKTNYDEIVRKIPDSVMIRELERRGVDLHHQVMDRVIRENYKMIRELGRGASGKVYLVENTVHGGRFALKVVEKNNKMNDSESMRIEIECLKKLRHRHLVNLYEVFETKQCVWLVTELMDGGQVADLFADLDHFSERNSAHAIRQVLSGVNYLHSMRVVHRDLKLENLLLTAKSSGADVKIADFGLAYILKSAKKGFENTSESNKMKACKEIHEPFCGTPLCMAPEVAIEHAQYGPQADLWSTGCILYEMLSGLEPFDADEENELYRLIQKAQPSFDDPEWKAVSKDAKDLVHKLLAKNPLERLSAAEALQHKWIANASDDHMADAHANLKLRKQSMK